MLRLNQQLFTATINFFTNQQNINFLVDIRVLLRQLQKTRINIAGVNDNQIQRTYRSLIIKDILYIHSESKIHM